ncbi:MAG: TIGR00268 family protein [Akkermansia sp.]
MNTLLDHLRSLAEQGGLTLAFSGGVDSALLLRALSRLRRERPLSLAVCFFRTPLHTGEEEAAARRFAEQEGFALQVLAWDPLQEPALRFNPPERCYLCKRQLFERLRAWTPGHILLDGTHADDLRTHRPGLRALRELGVRSPLASLGMGKARVRALAAEEGLSCAQRPAAPCLATRLEYGAELRPELLAAIARGEALLRGRFPGAALRLRVHRGGVARLELPPELLAAAAAQAGELAALLRPLGFRYLTLDLEGFRSGSMDETLNAEQP